MASTIEKDWTTEAGLRAVVLFVRGEHRCGYVGVPAGHPLHGVKHEDPCAAIDAPSEDEPGRFTSPEMAFDVHGSITFSGGGDGYPVAGDEWWFGYDCAHLGDAKAPEYYEQMRERYPDSPVMWGDDGGVFRGLEYCVRECESLARQIVERTVVQQ